MPTARDPSSTSAARPIAPGGQRTATGRTQTLSPVAELHESAVRTRNVEHRPQ